MFCAPYQNLPLLASGTMVLVLIKEKCLDIVSVTGHLMHTSHFTRRGSCREDLDGNQGVSPD